MQPTPRPATAGDIDDLMTLRVLMFEAMGTPAAQLESAAWLGAARDWFTSRIDHPTTRVLVVEDGGDIVAGGLAEVLSSIPAPSMPRGRLGFVSNIATLPHARGRGLARLVMTELVRWLDEETDADRIDLAATAEGAPLYRSLGFQLAAFPTMRRLAPVPGS
ncbi:GNAT family N-acetyltransferase [Knoellia subterranea]|uniref:Acetyltransferase n=1 Tax=Knoellia subterranea KCTC 19937 TaxID=1385521 RepID=A0A0A0JTC9_9MICO|nr:GNAT family N-acetyltransferase [Knoellia subterranea]KGN39332.1 acetyltransferase [Knoellia subterranea KCTC 19937]